MRSVAWGLLLLLLLFPAMAAAGQAVQSASGTVKSYTLEECEGVPLTCQGALVIQSSGDQSLNFVVPRGTRFMHGDRHWILMSELRPGDPVTVSFVTREGGRFARVVLLERRPLPGEMVQDQ